MNDKELLELAAKAAKRAGMNLLYGKSIDEQELQWHCDFAPWNPLTDDGDALRLAVKLNDYEPYKSRGGFRILAGLDAAEVSRSIVVAAAAIGKEMQ